MRLPGLLLCLALTLTWVGCDTGSDLSDAERIVGQWRPLDLNVQVGGALAVPVATIQEGDLRISSRSEFALNAQLGGKVIIPNTDVTVDLPSEVDLSGTYQLGEMGRTITVTRGVNSATFDYDFSTTLGGVETLLFIADSPEELEDLLEGAVDAELFFSVASGAAIRFERIQ